MSSQPSASVPPLPIAPSIRSGPRSLEKTIRSGYDGVRSDPGSDSANFVTPPRRGPITSSVMAAIVRASSQDIDMKVTQSLATLNLNDEKKQDAHVCVPGQCSNSWNMEQRDRLIKLEKHLIELRGWLNDKLRPAISTQASASAPQADLAKAPAPAAPSADPQTTPSPAVQPEPQPAAEPAPVPVPIPAPSSVPASTPSTLGWYQPRRGSAADVDLVSTLIEQIDAIYWHQETDIPHIPGGPSDVSAADEIAFLRARHQSEVADLVSQLDAYGTKLSDFETRVNEGIKERDTLQDVIQQLELVQDQLQGNLAHEQQRVTQLEQQNDQMQTQLQTLQAKLESMEKQTHDAQEQYQQEHQLCVTLSARVSTRDSELADARARVLAVEAQLKQAHLSIRDVAILVDALHPVSSQELQQQLSIAIANKILVEQELEQLRQQQRIHDQDQQAKQRAWEEKERDLTAERDTFQVRCDTLRGKVTELKNRNETLEQDMKHQSKHHKQQQLTLQQQKHELAEKLSASLLYGRRIPQLESDLERCRRDLEKRFTQDQVNSVLLRVVDVMDMNKEALERELKRLCRDVGSADLCEKWLELQRRTPPALKGDLVCLLFEFDPTLINAQVASPRVQKHNKRNTK